MGVLIETPVFYEHLSARENLEIHLAYMGCGTADIDNSLQMVGLADTGKKPVSKFSLGMKQRLAIARAILLFTYPINRKTVVWAKIKLLLLFVSVTTLVCTFGGFIVFTLTGHMFSLVDDKLQSIDIALDYRNALVLACLTDGIALCSLRIGFIRKSNSMTVISAIGFSMLLVNLAADINQSFAVVLGLSAAIFTIGLFTDMGYGAEN